MAGAKYKKGKRIAIYYRDTCMPKEFFKAFGDFKWLFRKKTGIEWDKRCDGLKGGAADFVYSPPIGGRPVGVLPRGWKEPEPEVHTDTDSGEGTDPEKRRLNQDDDPELCYDSDSSTLDDDSDVED